MTATPAAAAQPWGAYAQLGAAAALADPRLAGLLVLHSPSAGVLCVLLWYGGPRRVPAGVAGAFTGLLPASAAVAAVAVLGERFGAAHVVGFALMAASLLLATWPRRGAAG